jgi:hypothetical protein
MRFRYRRRHKPCRRRGTRTEHGCDGARDHGQRQRRLGREAAMGAIRHLPGNMRLGQARLVVRPALRQIEVAIDEGVAATGGVTGETPIWQLAILPAEPVYCRATPQDALPCFRKPVSSTTRARHRRPGLPAHNRARCRATHPHPNDRGPKSPAVAMAPDRRRLPLASIVAASATLALNAGECARRLLFVIIAPDPRPHPGRCQAGASSASKSHTQRNAALQALEQNFDERQLAFNRPFVQHDACL